MHPPPLTHAYMYAGEEPGRHSHNGSGNGVSSGLPPPLLLPVISNAGVRAELQLSKLASAESGGGSVDMTATDGFSSLDEDSIAGREATIGQCNYQ